MFIMPATRITAPELAISVRTTGSRSTLPTPGSGAAGAPGLRLDDRGLADVTAERQQQ